MPPLPPLVSPGAERGFSQKAGQGKGRSSRERGHPGGTGREDGCLERPSSEPAGPGLTGVGGRWGEPGQGAPSQAEDFSF